MRGRGRGGAKAPVQPEDGPGLGIRRLKRVADFGPPTVGTLPVRNKKRKKGRGGGPGIRGYANTGDGRNNGLPPRVGAVPRGGGAGRGGGRSGGQPSRGSSPGREKGKGREDDRWDGRPDDGYRAGPSRANDRDRERDSERDRERDREVQARRDRYGLDNNNRDYGQDYYPERRDVEGEEEYRNSRQRFSSPPRASSPPCRRYSPPPANRHYSPSQPVFGILSETESEVTDVPSSSRGALPSGVAPLPGISRPAETGRQAEPTSGPSRPMPSVSHQLEPPAVDAPPSRPPPKFKPRNHNVRENLPVPAPPPPPKEPTPPPPEPPKFKPRNHNPRKNDPPRPPPPKPATIPPPPPPPPLKPTTIPPPAHTPSSPPPIASRVQHSLPQQSQHAPLAPVDPPVPITTTSASALQDVKPDPAALAAARPPIVEETLPAPQGSPPKEGVEWIRPEDIPLLCMGHPQTTALRAERQNARKQFVTAQRKRLFKTGKVVVSSKWRGDGLAIDWRLSSHVPSEASDSDDDIVELIPPPRKATPEAIVIDDSPSPPQVVRNVGPDLSIPGEVTVEYPPMFSIPMNRKTEAFFRWRETQMARFRTPTNTVEQVPGLKGLRIQWNPVERPAEAPLGAPVEVAGSTVPVPIAPQTAAHPLVDVPRAASSGPSGSCTSTSQEKGKPSRTESASPRRPARVVSPMPTTLTPAHEAQPSVSRPSAPSVPDFGAMPVSASERTTSPGPLYPPTTLDALIAQQMASGPSTVAHSAYMPFDMSSLASAPGPSMSMSSEFLYSQPFGFATAGAPPSSSEWMPPPSGVPAAPAWNSPSEAVEWIDSAAIERAVAEATSTSRSRSGSRPLSGEPSSLGLFNHHPPYELPSLSSAIDGAIGTGNPAFPPAEPADTPQGEAPPPEPPATAAERLARLQTQLNVLFDRIDRWMRLQEDFPERAEQLQRQIERTELGIFDLQNQMDVEKRQMEAEAEQRGAAGQ